MGIKNLKLSAAILGFTSIVLSGCGKKEYVLDNTILDKAFVATVDEEIYFLRQENSKSAIRDVNGNFNYENGNTKKHIHYLDVITGEYLTDFGECTNPTVRKVDEISKTGSVLSKLTKDEMEKLVNNSLTAEDIINIIDRIKNKENAKVKEKTNK